ncbi:2-oxo acid dehydrogenase subunit E2 [Candidatus Sneabacter namystus]|uniref:Dihydrolipoamide acetyltransferase component of pyruvate dehydrogenase complex n=1 Tax=Candidatus Sneabacter namystus TaxID=2601646 RepID=A0A5C0UL84_9RICK|nr:2-oxo acid dehydrogenase subunit E2 [Candidatus Sneabacter namystus]QEK39624.1 pyruvate dehydrogenase complex dihydrolipoamide acetyltransferase [Candidatus Sneabacter namystus]
MPIDVLMPALSPTMRTGKLVKWTKKEGEEVKCGDVIAEIETDKAIMELESVDEGTLFKILVQSGTDNVEVNTKIAVLLEEGEDESSVKQVAPLEKKEEKVVSDEKDNQMLQVKKHNGIAVEDKNRERIFASPLARSIAAQNKIDLRKVVGTGPGGRIIKRDVLSFCTPVLTNNVSMHKIDISSMRRSIATKLSESKKNIPHFYLTISCNADEIIRLKQDLNFSLDVKFSINDFILKAAAFAMKNVPQVNSQWTEECIIQYNTVNICIAVALESGVVAPVVRDVNNMTLKQLSTAVKDCVNRARSGSITPEENQGGTFTVSNLGMYGIEEFSAIILPSQSAVLSVGSLNEVVYKDSSGAFSVKNVIKVTLSCDHRVLDGAVAAKWLSEFKNIIEHPSVLLL